MNMLYRDLSKVDEINKYYWNKCLFVHTFSPVALPYALLIYLVKLPMVPRRDIPSVNGITNKFESINRGEQRRSVFALVMLDTQKQGGFFCRPAWLSNVYQIRELLSSLRKS